MVGVGLGKSNTTGHRVGDGAGRNSELETGLTGTPKDQKVQCFDMERSTSAELIGAMFATNGACRASRTERNKDATNRGSWPCYYRSKKLFGDSPSCRNRMKAAASMNKSGFRSSGLSGSFFWLKAVLSWDRKAQVWHILSMSRAFTTSL